MRFFLINYALFFLINSICFASTSNKILIKPFKVQKYEFYEKYSAVGQALREGSRDYYANKNGVVSLITPKQGQKVEQGEVIIAIESDMAKSNLEYAQINLENSKQEFVRNKSLFEKKVLSKKDFDLTRVAFEKAEADYFNTLKAYNDSVITAPFEGTVGVVNAIVGNNVKIGDYLFSLITNNRTEVIVELPETLHGKIFKNTEVTLTDSNNNNASGTVSFISPYLSNNGTITVKIETGENNNFIHGSFINVTFTINRHEALGILQSAILKNDKGNFVYKVEDNNTVKQLYVDLGIRTDDMIEILNTELHENDLVIIEGLTKVKEGEQVEIIRHIE